MASNTEIIKEALQFLISRIDKGELDEGDLALLKKVTEFAVVQVSINELKGE